jgi:hypothetical protein
MNQQQSQQRATTERVRKRSREATRSPIEPPIPEAAGDPEITRPAGLTEGGRARRPGEELGGSRAPFLTCTHCGFETEAIRCPRGCGLIELQSIDATIPTRWNVCLTFATPVIAFLVALWASESLGDNMNTFREFRHAVVVVGALTVATIACVCASAGLRFKGISPITAKTHAKEQVPGSTTVATVPSNERLARQGPGIPKGGHFPERMCPNNLSHESKSR